MTDPFQYRDANGNLRLDELLGEEYVRHYTRILSSSSEEFSATQLSMAVQAPPAGDPGGAYSWREPRRGVLTSDGWLLSPEGTAERWASSVTDLAVQPGICWDVCGYYRLLRVHWRADARELRVAYLEVNPDDSSEPVRYAYMQLRDPVIRRAYDMTPLGGLFMGDRDVRAMIERRAAVEAARRNAEAGIAGEDFEPEARHKEVLRDWGFEKASAEEATSRLAGGGFRQGTASDELGSTLASWERNWGWYRMTDPYDDDPWEGVPGRELAALLERWQAMIARALSARRRRVEFAVGIWPGNEPKAWRDSNEPCIVFLVGQGHPTQQRANEAVRGFLAASDTRQRPKSRQESY